MFMPYLCLMKSEELYIRLELALRERGFNPHGVWDKINYTAKMLMCDRMVANGSWMELPDEVIYSEDLVL